MQIQIDSREKAKAIQGICKEFSAQHVRTFVSKLYVGDYVSLDNSRLVVDRKQNLLEVCGNMTQQHTRFRAEMERAVEAGIDIVFLVEHGGNIKSIEDVEKWKNPRTCQWERKIREQAGCAKETPIEDAILIAKQYGYKVPAPPTSGRILAKQMRTTAEKYGVRWEFCSKKDTGKRIIEILQQGGV